VYYTAVRATYLTSQYVALFEITVVGPPAAATVAETEEASGLFGDIVTYAIIAGVVAGMLVVFVI